MHENEELGQPLRCEIFASRILNGGRTVATTLGRLKGSPRRSVLVALLLGIILFTGGVSTTAAQTPEREMGGLTLSSNSPGTLQVSWEAVSPTPTDHRMNWAKSSEGFPSWRDGEGNGNAYPESNSYTLTGLEGGRVEYKVRVRA